MLMLAWGRVGASAAAQFDLTMVEVLLEPEPLGFGNRAVLVSRTALTAAVEESLVVADDVLIEHGLWRRQVSELSECLVELGLSCARPSAGSGPTRRGERLMRPALSGQLFDG